MLFAAGLGVTGRTKTYFIKNQKKSQQPLILHIYFIMFCLLKLMCAYLNSLENQKKPNKQKNDCLTQICLKKNRGYAYNACRL